MQISAALVKELRERTGAGMMECKNALVEAEGNIEAAVDLMRKSGQAKADKKAGRIAAEGVIGVQVDPDRGTAAMVEVNCETDFVAREDTFRSFVEAVTRRALEAGTTDAQTLLETELEPGGDTVETQRRDLVAKIGENIAVRRVARLDAEGGTLGTYVHGGGRIGVLVSLQGGGEPLARDIAMHIAWSRPVCVSGEQVPADMLAKEREILAAQAESSGKPPEIAAKMVEGRLKKFLREVTLLGQPFVKNTDISVEQHLKEAGARVIAFERFEIGEGVEKKAE